MKEYEILDNVKVLNGCHQKRFGTIKIYSDSNSSRLKINLIGRQPLRNDERLEEIFEKIIKEINKSHTLKNISFNRKKGEPRFIPPGTDVESYLKE